MLLIEYPEPGFKIKVQDNKEMLFDPIRKKWLLLTPEEWVRQNFVQYLVQVKKYPVELIALEKMIMLGELKKRFDILVYNKTHQPWMMLECKGPEVTMDKQVLHQILRYHAALPVEYLVITNGDETYAWKKEKQGLLLIEAIPTFPA